VNDVFHVDAYMGDISLVQGISSRKFRFYEKSPFSSTCEAMKSGIDIDALRHRIEAAMVAKGFTRHSLSLKAGMSATGIKDLINRVDNPGIGTLHKIAEALDVSFEHLVGGGSIPLVGDIGAGGEIILFPNSEFEHEMVARPPLTYGPVIALRVAGDSMLPKYDSGDIVYVRREHDGVLPTYIGSHCAVHLADGGTYLKILSAGTEPGKYTLRSLNAADMENVEVIWASPVLFIMPRSARL
jgi:SOS-response transcriptional repressor LexA